MPAYDYTCARCGHLTEVIHGIHDSGPAVCPSCGAVGTMRKGFSAPAVHFKGSGWAKKDRSASSSAAAKAKPAAEGASTGSGADSSSSDGSSSRDSSAADTSAGKKTPAVTSASTSSKSGGAGGSDD